MKKWITYSAVGIVVVLTVGFILIKFIHLDYAYIPSEEKIIGQKNVSLGYDVWGDFIDGEKGKDGILKTQNEHSMHEAENVEGTVKIDDELLEVGRDTFYKETFGNEVFLTDIMGMVDGAFTITNVAKAIAKLGGQGTTNLQVELAKDVRLGDKTYKKGEKIDTGIDVAEGSFSPMGMPVTVDNGEVKVGISCAACHATVSRDTKQVIEGAPNNDFNAGLLMALATNSTAYFTHTQIQSLNEYITNKNRKVETTKGEEKPLPDPEKLEKAVDGLLVKWPTGNFDSTIDMKNNPAQIPDSFTIGDHPFGWSGFALAGPFNGLSTFSNNVHAQNADSTSQAEASDALFNIDKEIYLGTILQNAAHEDFRYNPLEQKEKPSEFFAKVDPTPNAPGVNELVKSPNFPKVSLVAPDGLIASSPGYPFNQQNNGVAAYQNTIRPPKVSTDASSEKLETGRRVFNRAGCISCHAGNYFTNNQIIPAQEIGTEPSRAKSLKKTEKIFGEALLYSQDVEVPIPNGTEVIEVPTDHLERERKLGWAHGTEGGYKVPSLIGLNWSAPYLHDGGVAVGFELTQLGLPGTLMENNPVDPRNSLQALIDKDLRQKVVEANRKENLQSVHVEGIGHEFWVDESTGFTQDQQKALIEYLLTLEVRD